MISKYPPIQGGVSTQSFWLTNLLARNGHQVFVTTNAEEVEDEYREWMMGAEEPSLVFANGGFVKVRSTFRKPEEHQVPESRSFVPKLAALATEDCRRYQCQAILSFYLDPYSLGGYLVSRWTGLPHIVRHAGTDVGNLMAIHQRALAYKEVLRSADVVISRGERLLGLGLNGHLVPPPRAYYLPSATFSQMGPVLNISALISELLESGVSPHWRSSLDPEVPTIGIYGKVGISKGFFDLVDVLGDLREEGYRFNFLAMTGGRQLSHLLKRLRETKLSECTTCLPFLPPWKVPEFLRACTAVCVLERDFPVPHHTTILPREVMSTGTCLIASQEAIRKMDIPTQLKHLESALIIDNPSNHVELKTAIRFVIGDPNAAKAIGSEGASSLRWPDEFEYRTFLEEVLERAIGQRHQPRADFFSDVQRLLRRFMPRTIEALGPGILDLAHKFSTDNICEDVMRVSEILVNEAEQRGKVLGQVSKYEQCLLWMAVDLEGQRGTPIFPSMAPDIEGNEFVALRPVRSNWIRVVEFTLPMETLQYQSNVETSASSATSTFILFQKRSNLIGRVHRIGHLTKRVLDLVDGSRTVGEIITRLQVEHPDIAAKRLETLIDELFQNEVLAFRYP